MSITDKSRLVHVSNFVRSEGESTLILGHVRLRALGLVFIWETKKSVKI